MIRIRLVTPLSGEIREFDMHNLSNLKRYLVAIRKQCKQWDNFDLDYKTKDIIKTLSDNEVYQSKNCIIENVNKQGYTLDKVYDLLKDDVKINGINEDFINFVNMLNDKELISTFGETNESEVLNEYLTWTMMD